MSDQERPLFEGMDEYEREYAPEELPEDDPERARARADQSSGRDASDLEPPAAAPIGTLGSSPSGAMAVPNIGHRDHGGAPGDPETEADYPIGNAERNDELPDNVPSDDDEG